MLVSQCFLLYLYLINDTEKNLEKFPPMWIETKIDNNNFLKIQTIFEYILIRQSFQWVPLWINYPIYNRTDIRIYVPYSRPNGWTEWAEIFFGHLKEIFF